MNIMNVKTIFSFKNITCLLFLIIGVSLFTLNYARENTNISFECISDVNIIKNGSKGSTVRISFLALKNGNGAINEYGIIEYDNNSYIVNRNVKIKINHAEDDYYEIIREPPILNEGDNLPSSLYYALVSKDKVLNYRIIKSNNGLITIRDNKRTIFMCAENKL